MSIQDKNNHYIIGVDVSKDKLDIYGLNTNKVINIANNEKDIKKFIKSLEVKPDNSLFVMESTGGYEKLLRKLLNSTGYQVHIAHPLRVHYFAKQKGYFAKTDSIDARAIKQYGEQENVQPTLAETKEAVELKELSSRRAQLIDLLTIEKCRIKPHQTKGINKSLKRHVTYLETEIALLDEKISKLIESDDTLTKKAARIQTVKGIGKKTANMLVSMLPELGLLNRAEIACLCGVAPKNKDSGIKTGKRHIFGGRGHVRKALYMVAVCASTHNPTMAQYYQKLKGKGKESKVALIAVMRKIVITLNAMIRDEKDFCYDYNNKILA